MAKMGKVSTAVGNFEKTRLAPERLRDYMCSLACVSDEQAKDSSRKAPGISLMANPHRFHPSSSKSLYALDSASKIYNHLIRGSISLKLTARPLCDSAWFQCLFNRWEHGFNGGNSWSTQTPLLTPLQSPLPNRLETFGCIVSFDSGTIDLDPESFEHAFAVCSEDTIYVPAVVLSDPFVRLPEYEMRSITGNVSRAGISILVSPLEPRIRELSNSYNVVAHETYDSKREDNFRDTSLHLAFTDWTMPLVTENSRTIDHDAQVVEAVISVRDRGCWVADIDMLAVDFERIVRFEPQICREEGHDQHDALDYTSIDSWEELLDEPSTVGIFRAHGNWAARLAAVGILSRSEAGGQNFGLFGPDPFCLSCLEKESQNPTWNMLEYESALPSFCID